MSQQFKQIASRSDLLRATANRTNALNDGESGGGRKLGQAFTLVLFGMFMLVLLLALWMGTTAFSSVSRIQTETDEMRLSLNSLANRVHGSDQAGSFSVGKGPEGPSIVLSLPLQAGTYETRIYAYQGHIVEEPAFSTDPYLPATATQLVASETFDFTYEKGLLTVTTDQGTVCVALRTANGGVA